MQRNSRTGTFPIIPLSILIGGVLVSCLDVTPPRDGADIRRVGDVLYSTEGCWPIGPSCNDRALTQDEKERFLKMANGINEGADPRCAQIKGALADDIGFGNVRIWTDAPQDKAGDRHNSVDISHMTTWTLGDGLVEQKKTLIHETAHALGFGAPGDSVAIHLENICFGVLESS